MPRPKSLVSRENLNNVTLTEHLKCLQYEKLQERKEATQQNLIEKMRARLLRVKFDQGKALAVTSKERRAGLPQTPPTQNP